MPDFYLIPNNILRLNHKYDIPLRRKRLNDVSFVFGFRVACGCGGEAGMTKGHDAQTCSVFCFIRLCREFIDKQIVDFAKANPEIVVNVHVRGNKHPYILGEYSMFLAQRQ